MADIYQFFLKVISIVSQKNEKPQGVHTRLSEPVFVDIVYQAVVPMGSVCY